MKNKYSSIAYILAVLVLLNLIGSKYYKRFDLTEDRRYTLSETTKDIIKNADDAILIKVYLKGDHYE